MCSPTESKTKTEAPNTERGVVELKRDAEGKKSSEAKILHELHLAPNFHTSSQNVHFFSSQHRYILDSVN